MALVLLALAVLFALLGYGTVAIVLAVLAVVFVFI